MAELNKIFSAAIVLLAIMIALCSIPIISKSKSKTVWIISLTSITLLFVFVIDVVLPFMDSATTKLQAENQAYRIKAATVIGTTSAGQLVSAVAGTKSGLYFRTHATIETTTGVFSTDAFTSLSKGREMYVQSRGNGAEYLCDEPLGGNCTRIVR